MGTSKPCLLAWSLAAVLLASSLQLGSAQATGGEEDSSPPSPPFDPNDPDAAYLFGFPFCRCTDYRCGTSPYKPVKASEEVLANGNYKVCFSFTDQGCQAGNTCCNKILQMMGKFEVMADKTCSKAITAVTFGNVSRIGSTHFDTEFAVGKVRVTNLGATRAMVRTSLLCYTLKAPCNSFDAFFQSGKLGASGLFQYAIFNEQHDCCPTCINTPPNKTLCDCISVFEPNTRWRFRYRASELKGSFNYFSFNIFAVPSDQCLEVNTRPGFCCDQTLDSIEVALSGEFMNSWWKLVPNFWLYDVDGSTIDSGKISTQHKSDFGLIFDTFKRNTTQVLPGQELVLTLALNASIWNDTAAFPCGQSHLVDEGGICDYLLGGDQTFDNKKVISPLGDYVPGCCPEGVYLIENPEVLCGCTDNMLESPYRLAAAAAPEPANRGTLRYSYDISTTEAMAPEVWEESNCNNMDLDRIRLYVRAEVTPATVSSIFLNGMSVLMSNVAFGNDSAQSWLEVRELGRAKPAVGTVWQLDVTVKDISPPSLCAPNALGTGGCEYVFYGKYSLRDLEYQCCAHGLSEATSLEQEPAQCSCDANVLHTPYRLDYANATYDRAVDITTMNYTITYDGLDCDASDPLNGGCCASDLKTLLIEMDTASLKTVVVTPAVAGLKVETVPTGVKLTGLFGSGVGYDVSVLLKGTRTLSGVCGFEGCKYRFEGGFSVSQPYGCCPQDIAGL
ncbi:hypothetical protein TSOC_010325 [Tetrabaena socialis]|uniref:Pherophorin domain-containing protein n=1 Tax=Tetrabaena socialis TaxID=47790 RepID=A0A2J7ZTK4_9CHLO|nr:hypothetical protein TSOC_010325 [Tetrabaena socialis]|eukprot:PNH03603.1 hypothetical protein TSOC_010325 [Tetrabaena socialis]